MTDVTLKYCNEMGVEREESIRLSHSSKVEDLPSFLPDSTVLADGRHLAPVLPVRQGHVPGRLGGGRRQQGLGPPAEAERGLG